MHIYTLHNSTVVKTTVFSFSCSYISTQLPSICLSVYLSTFSILSEVCRWTKTTIIMAMLQENHPTFTLMMIMIIIIFLLPALFSLSQPSVCYVFAQPITGRLSQAQKHTS